MSKNRIVFILGFAVLILPHLGFPSSWEHGMLFLVGLLLVVLSFSVSASKRTARIPRRPRKGKESEVFVEGYTPLSAEDSVTGENQESSEEDNTPLS